MVKVNNKYTRPTPKVYNKDIIYHKEVSTHQLRCYHSLLVEIIVKSVNLMQMSKWKIFISMMKSN